MDEVNVLAVREGVALAGVVVGGVQQGAADIVRAVGVGQDAGGFVQGDETVRMVFDDPDARAERKGFRRGWHLGKRPRREVQSSEIAGIR